MSIIDISVTLKKGMPVWPGSIEFEIQKPMSMKNGDAYNLSNMRIDMHMGTHIDAPLHFLDNGASVDELSLDIFNGPVFVADIGDAVEISIKELERANIPEKTERVLFKTKNSQKLWNKGEFDTAFVALTPDAADWLVKRNVKMAGSDYLSVQKFNDTPEVHYKLLGAGIGVLEGVDLSKVQPGEYELICLPLKIAGAEGAPARAALRPLKEKR